MGVTGVGKTLFIKELSKKYQVIDFEGLAKHKGSILGNIPNTVQPSQKLFETLIYEKLHSFNSRKNIWVEAESIKVGKLSIPSKIWKNMPLGKNVKIKSNLTERVKFILKDYKYFTNSPDLMKNALIVLKKIIPKEEFKLIEINLKKKEYFQFVKSLIEYHYDRAYRKTRAENDSNIYKEIYLNKINLINIKRVIKESNYF
jgi:tRNA 2-selenouridine synthase